MKKEAEELFYVKIKDPVEFRRYVLGCLKDTIQLLQRYEEFKRIREKKIEYIMLYKNTVAEITKLNSQLKLELPKVKTIAPKITEQTSRTGTARSKSATQIERLENDIEDIESKLKSLV